MNPLSIFIADESRNPMREASSDSYMHRAGASLVVSGGKKWVYKAKETDLQEPTNG
jgi:hypothetical protein